MTPVQLAEEIVQAVKDRNVSLDIADSLDAAVKEGRAAEYLKMLTDTIKELALSDY